jgi:hypothetical protein
MVISQPGPPTLHLTERGSSSSRPSRGSSGGEPTRYAVAAAQAVDVMLDAIGHSDGSRASVARNLFATSVSDSRKLLDHTHG